MNSKLYFFNDSKQGRPDTNTAIEEFEGDKNFISISFIRELVQNAIDAVYDLNSKPKQFLYADKKKKQKALVIEEYNTIGLTGPVNRSINDEPEWHYSNYMFGLKRSSKSRGGGSKGVGKITSNLASELRTVIFVTSRSDDNEVWAGGKIELDKPQRSGDEVFNDHAFLSSNDPGKSLKDITELDRDKIHQPITDQQEIKLLKDAFQIERPITNGNSEYGTSWVIPAPIHATSDSKTTQKLTSVDQYLETILSEYGWAIMKGLIEIDLNGKELNQEKIIPLLKSTFPNNIEKWTFFEDVALFPTINEIRLKANWYENDNLEDAFLSEPDLTKAHDGFESGNRDVICLKLPLSIIKEDVLMNTSIKLFIQKSSDLDSKSNEMLYRNYLLITNESNTLSNTYGDSINAMLLIDDDVAVNFCRAAEQADHLKFVIKQAVKKGYKESSVKENLKAIRCAVKKGYEMFNNVEIEDQNLFSNIFSIITPLDLKEKQPKKRKKPAKQKTKISKKSYAGVSQIVMHADPAKDEITFKPGPNKLRQSQLPLSVKVKLNDLTLLSSKLNILNLVDDGFSFINVVNKLNSDIQNNGRDFLEFEVTDEDFELHIKDIAVSRTAKISLEY